MSTPDFNALNPMGRLMGSGLRRAPRPMAPVAPPPPEPEVPIVVTPISPRRQAAKPRDPRPSDVEREERTARDARLDAWLARHSPATEEVPEAEVSASETSPAPLDPTRYTVREKILLAAATLTSPFRVEALAVACWSMWPESFALEGHPEHVDSGRVYAKISGVDGALARGWLRHVSPRVYAVRPNGMRHAGALRRRLG